MADNYNINTLGENGENALFYLVKKHNEKEEFSERLKIAIQMGVEFKIVNAFGDNLLHCFAESGSPDYYLDELLN